MKKLDSRCEYVAIFDSDFKPQPDFLRATVPYLITNPRVGFVQARWTFLNPDETFLTKARSANVNQAAKRVDTACTAYNPALHPKS